MAKTMPVKKDISNKAIINLSKDKILEKIIKLTTLDIQVNTYTAFESLVKSIVSQQLSVKSAASIYARLKRLLEDEIKEISIIATDHEALRACGLSNRKAAYIRNTATFFLERGLDDLMLHSLSDDEMVQLLTQIKGVGAWTVQMLLIFHFLREDVFPIGDLEIRKQMIAHYNVEEEGKDLYPALELLATKWKPYRSIASRYLWSYGHLARSTTDVKCRHITKENPRIVD